MNPVNPSRRLILHRFALTAFACSLLGSVAPSLSAAPQPPVLVSSSGEALLELASGETFSARLPEGATLETTATLDSGWLAAGTQPTGTEAKPASTRDLLLLTGNGQTVSTLPSPPGKTAALRQEPLPLVEDGRLTGLVWLEGENRRSFGVRFAAWTGTAWDTPEVVAPPGPGSQLALTAARLRNGTWLLAWSAFDGHDDEIVWSRRVHGAWSRPQRVAADNNVPDITPALTAASTAGDSAGDSALLAWSRYDAALGEYRVVMSRFVQGHWTAPEAAAPPGSFYPTFEAAPANKLRVLYRTAMPQGWEMVEMDTAGHAIRHAAVTAAERARPVVSTSATNAAVFRWPAAGMQRSAVWTSEERKP